MQTVWTIGLFAVGVLIIIKSGDLFVSASVAIASHLRIPRVVIGGTLVSLATTSPELTVSTIASLRGNPGLAVGNAVGSVICNIGLIVGLLCVLRPMSVKPREFRFPSRFMLATGVLLTVLTMSLRLGRSRGALLLGCGLVYLAVDTFRNRRAGQKPTEEPVPDSDRPTWGIGRSAVMFLLGAALVVIGSKLLADNGVKLATMLGVPPMIIGLTLVAMGTSLPELVTAISAARQGVPELSLGNVVGANIMNMTLVTGVSGIIRPLTMTRGTQLYNFPAMLTAIVLLLILARTDGRLTRREGWVLLLFYGCYVGGLILFRA